MPRRRSTGPSRRCGAPATTLRPRSRERRRRERRPADARPPRRRRALRRADPDLPAPARGRRGGTVRPAAGPRPAPRRRPRPGPGRGPDRRPAAAARGAAGRERLVTAVPITPLLCGMARGLVGWSVLDLARKAEIDPMALARFESGRGILRREMLAAIRRTLEEAGVEFPNGAPRMRAGP